MMAEYDNCSVRYQRGNAIIAVDKIEGFGINYGLWIGTENPNKLTKVASFGNDDKAMTFCKWLDYLLDHTKEPPKEDIFQISNGSSAGGKKREDILGTWNESADKSA